MRATWNGHTVPDACPTCQARWALHLTQRISSVAPGPGRFTARGEVWVCKRAHRHFFGEGSLEPKPGAGTAFRP